MSRFLYSLLFAILVLTSCFQSKRPIPDRPLKKVWGYKPVYTTDTTILRIVADTARGVKNAGKIYAFQNLIFQSDVGEGIHILDRANPSDVKNLGFLRIKGSSEISIKGNFLYTNSYSDLVVVDITDWKKPLEVRRVKKAFKQGSSVPGLYTFIPLPEHGVYYDCMNMTAGFQTGWVRDSVYDQCYYR